MRRLAAGFLGLFAAGGCEVGLETFTPSSVTTPGSSAEPVTPPNVAPTTPVIPLSARVHPSLAVANDDNPARPIVTGTLLTTSDGKYAFAADVDRDAVFKVELSSRAVSRIGVPVGHQPAQLTEGVVEGQPRVFVVLRGGGAVLAIDPATNVTQTYPACRTPRGLTYDSTAAKIYVACQTGELQTLDAATGALERSVIIAPDLRDVQLLGSALLVSRYRSAELLTVDAAGSIINRTVPEVLPGCSEAAVMHRLVVRDSKVHMAHQLDTTVTLETFHGGYGSGRGCAPTTIEPIVIVTDDVEGLSTQAPEIVHIPSGTVLQSAADGPQFPDGGVFAFPTERALFGMIDRSGPLDLAVSNQGRVALIFTGDSLWPEANALVTLERSSATTSFSWRYDEHAARGTLTAVAFDAEGHWLAQSRQPAQLSFEDGSVLVLDTQSAANTGLDLFYVNTGRGLSCAGCHPEGDEDGRSWLFPQGVRRTQTLGGGVMSRAPFHWDGEMPEMKTLITEVMMKRMSFATDVSAHQIDILGRWLDDIPASSAMKSLAQLDSASAEAAAVDNGRTLFNDATVGCAKCHSGPSYTDNQPYDVGTGGVFYTPTLLGIAARDAFLHDGCASTLTQRFGICGGGDAHGKTSHLTASQIGELVAYLQTL